jgi:hypothetical protein
MPYAVLQRGLEVVPQQTLAGAISSIPGFTTDDAGMLSRRAFGILLMKLELDQANALQLALKQEGVETEVVDQARLQPLPAPQKLKRADCQPTGLVLYDALDGQRTVDWQQVILLATGRVTVSDFVEQEPYMVAFDSHSGPVRVNARFREKNQSHVLLDIFLRDGSRFEVLDREFRYDYLGQRMVVDTWRNFTMFVRDLASFSKDAALNRGVTGMLQEPSRVFDYPNRKAFEAESLFLLYKIS